MPEQARDQIAQIEHEPMEGVGPVDWILVALTFVPSAVLLMFAISPVMQAVHTRRSRRRSLWGMLVGEVVMVALVLAVVLR